MFKKPHQIERKREGIKKKMERSQKQRGFIKGKLMMPFNRAPKASTPLQVQYSSKVNPSRASPTPSVGFVVEDERVVPSRPLRPSFVKREGGVDHRKGHLDASSGGGGSGPANGEDSVDNKAATYISFVQERFRLQRVDSDRRQYQEMLPTNVY